MVFSADSFGRSKFDGLDPFVDIIYHGNWSTGPAQVKFIVKAVFVHSVLPAEQH